ncbi:LexA family protein [Lacticaseibacillus absianus]|uniref:LexA family protein n=1 Tax=Lacticaseibacillus absianus TaxID=2729623 RepID=UPI0015CDA0A0|nr:helix-turn-helix domain-containing protein [Lacticaseibacillus absianus]
MLTPREWRDRSVDVLTLIEDSLDNHGYPPTLTELATKLGFAKATIYATLQHMQREGMVEWERNGRRTLSTTEKGDELYEASQGLRKTEEAYESTRSR